MFRLPIFSKCFLLFLIIGIPFTNAKISCLKCDSKTNPNCSIRPDTIKSTESCERECVTLIDDDSNTVRRCLLGSEKCREPNCDKCDIDRCNSEVFPSNRKKCYQCLGSTCSNLTSSHLPLPCTKFVDKDECFTYVFDESNAVRGCVSDQNQECIKAKDLCITCDHSDGCNNHPGTYTVSCFNCSSVDNRLCQKPDIPTSYNTNCEIDNEIPKCSYQELLGRQSKCHTAIIENNVVRSCKPTETYIGLYNCAGDLCNKDCIENGENRLKLFNKTYLKYTVPCHGCENGQEETVLDFNLTRNDKSDGTARTNSEGSFVNQPSKLACYTCDSKTNPKCSNHVETDAIESKLCQISNVYCIATLTQDGYTERGCMDEITNAECSEDDPNCIKCMFNKCNYEVVPRNRIRCHKCDGATDDQCNKEQSEESATVCARYVPNDKCYTFATAGQTMVRGCQSDQDNNWDTCNKLEENKCAKCDSLSCNKLPYKATPTLECHTCDANNIECAWTIYNRIPCQQEFEYWKEESCFIYKHENGSVTRGCTLDTDLCSNKDDKKCMKYNSSNGISTIKQSCYKCESTDKNCANDPEKTESIICNDEFALYEFRGCYKLAKESNVERGCLTNTDTNFVSYCKYNPMCHICYSENCNKSSSLEVSLLAVLSILFYWMFSYTR